MLFVTQLSLQMIMHPQWNNTLDFSLQSYILLVAMCLVIAGLIVIIVVRKKSVLRGSPVLPTENKF